MDILIVSSEAPPITSGVSRCVDRLTSGLRGRGHHVDVLSSLQVPRFAVRELRLSSLRMHWHWLAEGLRDYDVVNLHGPAPTVSDVFLHQTNRLPVAERPPLVYTHHGPMAVRGLGPVCALYNTLHRVLSRRSDLIVASSKDYADYHFMPGGAPVLVVPWGVDPVPLGEHPAGRPDRVRAGFPPLDGAPAEPWDQRCCEPLRVLFVGQMRPYKGVETLLQAVSGQPGISLTLVGRGPRLDHYRRLAARLRARNAMFTGWLPDQALAAQYARHDVIVLPSITAAEAYGLVLLEGMRFGCVPVASDLPGVREVAGPSGELVPPGDPQTLRETLVALASDRFQLERLRRLSVRRAERLSWDGCVARYEQLLTLAVERRRGVREPPVEHRSTVRGQDGDLVVRAGRFLGREPGRESDREPGREPGDGLAEGLAGVGLRQQLEESG